MTNIALEIKAARVAPRYAGALGLLEALMDRSGWSGFLEGRQEPCLMESPRPMGHNQAFRILKARKHGDGHDTVGGYVATLSFSDRTASEVKEMNSMVHNGAEAWMAVPGASWVKTVYSHPGAQFLGIPSGDRLNPLFARPDEERAMLLEDLAAVYRLQPAEDLPRLYFAVEGEGEGSRAVAVSPSCTALKVVPVAAHLWRMHTAKYRWDMSDVLGEIQGKDVYVVATHPGKHWNGQGLSLHQYEKE